MYNVIDSDEIKSLVETAKSIETNINSILIETDERHNIFTDGLPMLENLPLQDIFKFYVENGTSFIVMYDTHNLNNQLIEFMNMGLVPIIKRSKKTVITELHYKFKMWPETLFVTVGIIDKTLMKWPNFRKNEL
jgi:hypothetical protein